MRTRGLVVGTSAVVLLLAGCSSSSGSGSSQGLTTVSVTSACPTKVPAATPLAPVLAQGVPTAVHACTYPFVDPATTSPDGPTSAARVPQAVYDELTRASRADVKAIDCPAISGAPVTLVMTYANTPSATVVFDPGGCPSIVQDDKVNDASGGADHRRIYLPEGSTLP